MSFFKKIFNKSEKEQRKLTAVNQLLTGDIIQLTDSFALPELLRNQQFQVSSVSSYEYEHNTQTEWTLSGSSNITLFLALEVDDISELKFSIKIEHADVESLFDLDEFAQIFDEPGNAFLTKKTDTNFTNGWSSDEYQQSVFGRVGYFHRKDHRSETLSEYEGKDSGEQFELYNLYNEDQTKAVEIEVWQDGETDVFLTLFRPMSDIVDMFPGS
jgi:hypothetical protein|tara:strand:+ start:3226 stop:3867 length:642 start_codon:yes stop_codon:yes gene_type:complete